MVQQDVLHKLQSEGWHLKLEAIEALEEGFQSVDAEHDDCSNVAPTVSQLGYNTLRTALLNCDYRKFGSGCLPDDVNRSSSSVVKGPYVLQVMSATDISKPSYATSSSNRLLLLKLTDGRISCKAMEHKQCNQLTDALLPGTKVVLDQATVKLGVIQLEPKSLRILGGRVDSLAEAFETQRKYGGINRPGLDGATGSAAGAGPGPAVPGEAAGARLTSGAAASVAVAADDGAAAPRFKMFVVGRDDSRRAAGSSSGRSRSTAAGGSVKPGAVPVAAGTSAAIAAAAVGAASKQQDAQEVKRCVDVAPVRLLDAQVIKQQSAAQAKLLDKLERSQTEASGSRGRGRGSFRGRRGRRGRHDSDDDDGGGAMTLEEYEAKQKGGRVTLSTAHPAAGGSAADEQMRSDEELARQLQAQLDLEEAGLHQQHQQIQPGYESQQRYGNRPGAAAGTSRREGGPLHIQYERQRHTGQSADGADYTDSMFDSFDYNARPASSQPMGRGRGSGPGGRRQWSEGRGRGTGDRGRGPQHGGGRRGGRGSGRS